MNIPNSISIFLQPATVEEEEQTLTNHRNSHAGLSVRSFCAEKLATQSVVVGLMLVPHVLQGPHTYLLQTLTGRSCRNNCGSCVSCSCVVAHLEVFATAWYLNIFKSQMVSTYAESERSQSGCKVSKVHLIFVGLFCTAHSSSASEHPPGGSQIV